MWCLAVQELKCVQCLHTTSVVVVEIMYEPLRVTCDGSSLSCCVVI